MKEKTDHTGWLIFAAVLGAFILLICAWVFFFWIAAHNRVADVSLEGSGAAHATEAGVEPATPQPDAAQAAEALPAHGATNANAEQ